MCFEGSDRNKEADHSTLDLPPAMRAALEKILREDREIFETLARK
jgi:hypothetical protein